MRWKPPSLRVGLEYERRKYLAKYHPPTTTATPSPLLSSSAHTQDEKEFDFYRNILVEDRYDEYLRAFSLLRNNSINNNSSVSENVIGLTSNGNAEVNGNINGNVLEGGVGVIDTVRNTDALSGDSVPLNEEVSDVVQGVVTEVGPIVSSCDTEEDNHVSNIHKEDTQQLQQELTTTTPTTVFPTLPHLPPFMESSSIHDDLQNHGPGWRIEFRPLELQLTDFENAAFAMFPVLFSRCLLAKGYDFYIPMSYVEENMRRAQKKDAVLREKFYIRRNILIAPKTTVNVPVEDAVCEASPENGNKTTDIPVVPSEVAVKEEASEDADALNKYRIPAFEDIEIVELTMDEIFNGEKPILTKDGDESMESIEEAKKRFPGLIPIIIDYIQSLTKESTAVLDTPALPPVAPTSSSEHIDSLVVATATVANTDTPLAHLTQTTSGSKEEIRSQLLPYLSLLSDKASGKLPTTAHWLRHEIQQHPYYNPLAGGKGKITVEVADDMMFLCEMIGMNDIYRSDLYGDHPCCSYAYQQGQGHIHNAVTIAANRKRLEEERAKEIEQWDGIDYGIFDPNRPLLKDLNLPPLPPSLDSIDEEDLMFTNYTCYVKPIMPWNMIFSPISTSTATLSSSGSMNNVLSSNVMSNGVLNSLDSLSHSSTDAAGSSEQGEASSDGNHEAPKRWSTKEKLIALADAFKKLLPSSFRRRRDSGDRIKF